MVNPSGRYNWASEGLGITRGRLVTEGVAPGGGSLTSAPQQEKAANRKKRLFFFIRYQSIMERRDALGADITPSVRRCDKLNSGPPRLLYKGLRNWVGQALS